MPRPKSPARRTPRSTSRVRSRTMPWPRWWRRRRQHQAAPADDVRRLRGITRLSPAPPPRLGPATDSTLSSPAMLDQRLRAGRRCVSLRRGQRVSGPQLQQAPPLSGPSCVLVLMALRVVVTREKAGGPAQHAKLVPHLHVQVSTSNQDETHNTRRFSGAKLLTQISCKVHHDAIFAVGRLGCGWSVGAGYDETGNACALAFLDFSI